jgi:UDP-N-acetylmuramyl pentapeptide phosphotransferase/UDP-N-acetylglucosamine-1-phosphate transferase
MQIFLISFLTSFLLTLLLVRFQSVHSKYSLDTLSGPQKVSLKPVSRIGGLAILCSITVAILFRNYFYSSISPFEEVSLSLVFCLLPAFTVGFFEDITKKAGILVRMLGIIASGMLAFYFVPVQIHNIGLPGAEALLMITFISLALTIFAITGLTNAYNLIDGFNGLASMVGILTLISISYVSFKNTDPLLVHLSLIMIGAITGFFYLELP